MPPSGIAISAGKTQVIEWTAQTTTQESKADAKPPFQCLRFTPIPTGLYKVGIVVYATEADAKGKANGRTIEKSFALGIVDAVWEVPIQ